MLQTVCQHCDTEVPEGRRFCDRCGAPAASAQLQAPDCPPGYQVYTHTWMGYSFHYPENWHVSLAPEGGAYIETSNGEAVLELHLLPPGAITTAPRQAELFLSRFGAVQFQVMPGSTDSYAQVVFANSDWQGMVSVHLNPRGGTIGVGRLVNGSALNLEPYFEQLMNSITPVKPIARQPWVDPVESSFCIHCPAGWKPQSTINPSPGAGSRVPVFTVSAEFAHQVFVVRDMQTRIFINGPLPEKPPAEEGFFGKLGRMANNLGNSMASAMGEVVCPFPGLGPALEHFFLPHWQEQMPGCKLLHAREIAPNQMDVRLGLPDGAVRVYRLQGDAFKVPGMTNRWAGGHVYFYQAPAEMMAQFESVLKGIAESFEPNPQWQSREQGRVRQQQIQHQQMHNQWMNISAMNHQARMNDIHRAGVAQQNINNIYNEISDMQHAGWQARQASSDYIQHETVNAIHGTSDFVNPHTGQHFNLPTMHNHYWENPTGDVILGSDSVLEAPPLWTPLEQISSKPR